MSMQQIMLAEGGSSAGASPVFVQGAITSGTGNSISLAYPSSNTAGSCLVVDALWCEAFVGADSAIVVTDSQGNTWTSVREIDNGIGQSYLQCWVAPNCGSGANTVTVTWTGSGIGAIVAIHEYSGVATTSPIDTSAASVASVSGQASVSVSITSTGTNELIHAISASTQATPGAYTDTAGYTQREQLNVTLSAFGSSQYSMTTLDHVGVTAATYSDTFQHATGQDGGAWPVGMMVALKSA